MREKPRFFVSCLDNMYVYKFIEKDSKLTCLNKCTYPIKLYIVATISYVENLLKGNFLKEIPKKEAALMI